MNKGQSLYTKAKSIIPGGGHLLSKRPEMFLPNEWPCYFNKAKGISVEDLDGRSFNDFSHFGVGTSTLGYSDDEVNDAVNKAISDGIVSTLMCPESVELSVEMLKLNPWADKVRLSRPGGEAMAVSVRIARAATGKDIVAFCGYHGWHDWYLAANLSENSELDGHLMPGLEPIGVPRGLVGTALPFSYNDLDSLEKLLVENEGEVAAVVMEPTRFKGPAEGFLEGVRSLATKHGVILIFDEITSGFRVNTGGIHMTMGVEPDMATYGKALGNGFAIAAIVGKGDIMSAAERSFISSTVWTEKVGPVAALATVRKHKRINAGDLMIKAGTKVKQAWQSAADKHGLDVHVFGIDPLSHFSFENAEANAMMTLYTQEMLDRGFLSSAAFYASVCHTDDKISEFSAAVDASFKKISEAVEIGNIEDKIRGGVKHTSFKRLN